MPADDVGGFFRDRAKLLSAGRDWSRGAESLGANDGGLALRKPIGLLLIIREPIRDIILGEYRRFGRRP
jgi:hypothetical protein